MSPFLFQVGPNLNLKQLSMIMLLILVYRRVLLVQSSPSIVVIFFALYSCVIFVRKAEGSAKLRSLQPLEKFSRLAENS